MPRCGKAHAELMHMHEAELLPLGDTDVTTLGKWLSNHDNMAQYCILFGRALRMAGQVTFPRQGVQCLGDGSLPAVTEGCPHLLPSGLYTPLRCLEGQFMIYQAGYYNLGEMGDHPKWRQ